MASAIELRKRFRALPEEQRDANQSFAIRVWRGLSWLERAEGMDAKDYEGRLISAWIGFNALYGRLDPNRRSWGDREAWGAFLALVWRIDHDERIRRVLFKRELVVLKLIDDKYLTAAFWEQGEAAARNVKADLRKAMARFGTSHMLPVLQLLFERLYVMRVQVFHGASTKGSSLNRRAMQRSSSILVELLAAMLDIMIAHGIEEDWGDLCFPPSS